MKDAIAVVFAVFMIVMLILGGVILVGCFTENWYERDLRERGLKQYNQQTGQLEWKIGAVVTERKD